MLTDDTRREQTPLAPRTDRAGSSSRRLPLSRSACSVWRRILRKSTSWTAAGAHTARAEGILQSLRGWSKRNDIRPPSKYLGSQAGRDRSSETALATAQKRWMRESTVVIRRTHQRINDAGFSRAVLPTLAAERLQGSAEPLRAVLKSLQAKEQTRIDSRSFDRRPARA